MSSAATEMSFNLVDKPWVQCLMADGSNRCLSLTEVFKELEHIKCLAGDSPQQDYAVLRILLVIFWRAHAVTEEAQECEDFLGWWKNLFGNDVNLIVKPVLEYLQKYRGRFDLLDSKAPFMQVADLQLSSAEGEISSPTRIIPESEKSYFSMLAGKESQSIPLPVATRWLIAYHAWDYAGIKSGVLGDPRVNIKSNKNYGALAGWAGLTGGVVIKGKNLLQTLLFNTSPSSVFTEDQIQYDLPVWEREPLTPAPRANNFPNGPCDVLTWQSRHVRLFYSKNLNSITGVIATNGDKIEIKSQFCDPMTGYRYSGNKSRGGKVVYYPKQHSEERTFWRGVEAFLSVQQDVKRGKGQEVDLLPETISNIKRLIQK